MEILGNKNNEETITLSIESEYAPLKAVLVHEPNIEIDRLTISNREDYLFEDIPFLKKMQVEHQKFVDVLSASGVKVIKLGNILEDLLVDNRISRDLIFSACELSLQPSLAKVLLEHYEDKPKRLKEILLYGITTNELYNEIGESFQSTKREFDPFLIEPIPNSYFTRDPACVVGNGVISCNMHFRARIRESEIIRKIFINHPLFRLRNEDFIFGNAESEQRPYDIEGGDIIVLNKDAIAIGRSQRTRSASIRQLAENLFSSFRALRVYEINIPANRAYMHLDTVFTVIDKGRVVAYPGVMDHITRIVRYEPRQIDGKIFSIEIEEDRPFNTILEDEFDGFLEVIHTANNDPRYADREQLADATNVFAIGPSKVITYDRGVHTNKALRNAGVEVLEIEGSELVRGLGGPRCMTMPLFRN